MLLCNLEADISCYRSSHRIPGHWKASANRDQSNPQALPYADFCYEPCRGQVEILVLLNEASEGEESKWRDC